MGKTRLWPYFCVCRHAECLQMYAVSTPLESVLNFPQAFSKHEPAYSQVSHPCASFNFDSRTLSKFNISSMVMQKQMHRMGLNPFSASMLIWQWHWRKRRRQVWTKHYSIYWKCSVYLVPSIFSQHLPLKTAPSQNTRHFAANIH